MGIICTFDQSKEHVRLKFALGCSNCTSKCYSHHSNLVVSVNKNNKNKCPKLVINLNNQKIVNHFFFYSTLSNYYS